MTIVSEATPMKTGLQIAHVLSKLIVGPQQYQIQHNCIHVSEIYHGRSYAALWIISSYHIIIINIIIIIIIIIVIIIIMYLNECIIQYNWVLL